MSLQHFQEQARAEALHQLAQLWTLEELEILRRMVEGKGFALFLDHMRLRLRMLEEDKVWKARTMEEVCRVKGERDAMHTVLKFREEIELATELVRTRDNG